LRLVDRARALRRRGDAGLARETLERAIEIDPANGSAYYDLAELHLDEGRPEQATTLAEKAILLGPQYGDEWLSHAHVLRGRALESSSRPNEAAAAYRRALELHAGNLPARIALRRLN
jgi:Tfp pilus assembly protein PilF